MSSFPVDPDEKTTREKILNTAFALFLHRGYDHTPIQALIDAVGIAKGTFYHHFPSKDAMLVSLVDSMTDRVIQAVSPTVLDRTRPVLTRILEISRLAAAQKAADMGPATLVVAKQMRQKSNRALTDCLNSLLQQKIRPLYLPLFEQAIAEGVFQLKHPEWAVDLMLTTIMGFQDAILECFLAFFEAPDATTASAALDRLQGIHETLEESLERQLGAAPGSLPLYTSVNLRETLLPIKGVTG